MKLEQDQGVFQIRQDDSHYPVSLKSYRGFEAPPSIAILGNVDILKTKPLALFSSIKCPGSIILKTYDLMKKIRDSGIAVTSGFHSPLERECLNILLKGQQPVIFCPPRGIEGMRLKPEIRTPLSDGRLLILSPFGSQQRRTSKELAGFRNHFVAALADAVLIPYAAPGSNTERLCSDLAELNKTIYTFPDEKTENLRTLGARASFSF